MVGGDLGGARIGKQRDPACTDRTRGGRRRVGRLARRRDDARTAAEWGLVNDAVPHASLRSATLKLAEQIAQASSLTIATGKQAYYAQIDLPISSAYEFTGEVMVKNAEAIDAQEGISAFLGKRQPRWCGR